MEKFNLGFLYGLVSVLVAALIIGLVSHHQSNPTEYDYEVGDTLNIIGIIGVIDSSGHIRVINSDAQIEGVYAQPLK